jgi:hypothetical protein
MFQILFYFLIAATISAQSLNLGAKWTQVSCSPGVESRASGVSCFLAECSDAVCGTPKKVVYAAKYPVTLEKTCSTSNAYDCSARFCEYPDATLVSSCKSSPLVINTNGIETTNSSVGDVMLSCSLLNGVVSECETGAFLSSSIRIDVKSLFLLMVTFYVIL